MSRVQFHSLEKSNIMYVIESVHHHNSISSDVGQFDTFGDGNTQHSSSWSVSIDQTLDFLQSLALHLHNNPEEASKVKYTFLSRFSKEEADFLEKLKYRKDKTVYYSINQQKNSTNDRLSYDKRYEVLPTFADGSAENVWKLFFYGDTAKWLNQLNKLFFYSEFREHWALKHNHYWTNDEFLRSYFATKEDTQEWNMFSNLLGSVNAITKIMKWVQAWEEFDCHVENIKRRIKKEEGDE